MKTNSIILVLVLSTTAFADMSVSWKAVNLGGIQWQYDYTITNPITDPTVNEVTIWFDREWYSNLKDVSGISIDDWNPLLFQPDNDLFLDGMYDLWNPIGLVPEASLTEVSIQFDWLGLSAPGSQVFEVVNPVNFQTIYQGTTTPESVVVPVPGSFLLGIFGLGFASYCLYRRHGYSIP